MAGAVRKSKMKEVPLSEVKDDLSRFLREAETQDVVITRHGKPAGVLIGFKSEDDWFDYRLKNDPRFVQPVEQGSGKHPCGPRRQAGRPQVTNQPAKLIVELSTAGKPNPRERPEKARRVQSGGLGRKPRGLGLSLLF